MRLTKSELNIMEMLWAEPDGLTSKMIRTSPSKSNSWQPQTFNVIMSGLIRKGATEAIPNWKNNGKGRLYKAQITAEEYYGQFFVEHNYRLDFERLQQAYQNANADKAGGNKEDAENL